MRGITISSNNKVTLVFEVYTNNPDANHHLGDVCRGNDTEFIESALQVALSELALIPMDKLEVCISAVHGGVRGLFWERFGKG